MKERILNTIYARFDEWAATQTYFCRKGCSTCCTLNVQITALEGRRILAHCRRQNAPGWLQDRLKGVETVAPPTQTTNEYILNPQSDSGSESTPIAGRCPFLEDDSCSIYTVRPFSCRCFVSTSKCGTGQAATVTDAHLYGAMAVQQIIEHLGQFDLWGNMVDMLLHLDHREFSDREKSEIRRKAMGNLRRAQPLPGFCYPETQQSQVLPLIRSILTSTIDGKTIEQILNGRE